MERSASMMAGERLVADRKLTLPIDPIAIAKSEGIEVREKPTSGGVSGVFMRVGDSFVIAYAAHVSNEGFQRFSVAHELGHYFLDGHIDHVLGVAGVHESEAGFTSRAPHEREADQFAAGLLMPTLQFAKLVGSAPVGLTAIEGLARTCRTSLTSTAIRTTQCARDAVAIVVCNQERVDFCFMSEAFKELKGLTWLKSQDPIPKKTATYAFVGDPGRILQGERMDDCVPLDRWFGGRPDVRLVEEVVGLGRYGKTLTVLSLEEDTPDDEEREDDEALAASWTPTLSKSRRR